jgi:hypothetical protein
VIASNTERLAAFNPESNSRALLDKITGDERARLALRALEHGARARPGDVLDDDEPPAA